MKGLPSRMTLRAVSGALSDLERRNVILRFRRERGIELQTIPPSLIANRITDQLRQEADQIVLDGHWDQIIHDFWSNIGSLDRTGAIMGYKMDHFQNRIQTLALLGVQSICFIQEGYTSPAVGVDFYFDAQTRQGIEAHLDESGMIRFSDPEVDQLWPRGLRIFLNAAALAHYQDIVCPHLFKEEPMQGRHPVTEEDEESTDEGGERTRRTPISKRAYFRQLPEGYKPSRRQIALAYAEGRFGPEEIERHLGEGRKTYVGEWVRPEDVEEANNPRRLIGVAVSFLDGYSRFVPMQT